MTAATAAVLVAAGCGGTTEPGVSNERSNADGGPTPPGDTCLTCDRDAPDAAYASTCGNGVVDSPEENCDGMDFADTNCTLLSMGLRRWGKLHCTSTCATEFVDCSDPRPGIVCDEGCGPSVDSGGTGDPQ